MSKRSPRKGKAGGGQAGKTGHSRQPQRGKSSRARSERRANAAPATGRVAPRPAGAAVQRDRSGFAPGKTGREGPVGAARSAGQDVNTILDFFSLRQGFDARTEREAETVAAWDLARDAESRADLRSLCAFTIDGADAKDFDDAVSIERLADGGARLGVHIADVSWYVRPGTLLDAQAQLRATSVYLPDRVLPMLPEALSNGCCSLLPGEDRLTVSALIDCDVGGEVRSYELTRAVIRSRRRLVYDGVNRLLQGDAAQVERDGDLLPDLQRMAALAAKLRANRMAHGALDLDVDEAAIAVDAQGEPLEIFVRPRGVAERMIEDFMLLANQVVARHAKARQLPCLYRVHEQMDPDKAASFAAFARSLGLRLRGARTGIAPQALQQVLKDAEALPEYPVIAQLMLRAMQKARYDAQPLGHFGLATDDYCHFTAPIRRYPDLFVHRALCAEMSGELRFCERALRATAPGLADHCSERERSAMEAERAVEKLMMARYMAGRVGEVYEGMVVSVVEWGLYVALPNTVEGLVHVRALPGYWVLNREQHCLVGDGSMPGSAGGLYRLGQPVRVRVESVDIGARQINFALEEAEAARRKRPGRSRE